MAQRCRDLLRIAVRPEVKEQLCEWVEDFEAEAKALEDRRSRRTADAETGQGQKSQEGSVINHAAGGNARRFSLERNPP